MDIGALKLTKEQIDILLAPGDPGDYGINPSGQVYVSHSHYRARLTAAFGPGGWGVIPFGDAILTKVKGDDGERHTIGISRDYGLYIQGVLVSVAPGYTAWDEDGIETKSGKRNLQIGYGDALESARSQAIVRCAKDLGMFRECWDKAWTKEWKDKNAQKGQYGWEKKKAGAPRTSPPPHPPAPPPPKPEAPKGERTFEGDRSSIHQQEVVKTMPTGPSPSRASLLARVNRLIMDNKATPKTFRELSGGKAAVELSDPELSVILDQIEGPRQ